MFYHVSLHQRSLFRKQRKNKEKTKENGIVFTWIISFIGRETWDIQCLLLRKSMNIEENPEKCCWLRLHKANLVKTKKRLHCFLNSIFWISKQIIKTKDLCPSELNLWNLFLFISVFSAQYKLSKFFSCTMKSLPIFSWRNEASHFFLNSECTMLYILGLLRRHPTRKIW